MIAPRLAYGQLSRPTVRAMALVAMVAGAWYAWSPGTAFGLPGVLGGWQFAGARLLDVGLVLLALTGALTGAGLRERRIDEHLHSVGLDPSTVVRATVVSGGLAALGIASAFAAGTGLGGLARSITRGGSWWVDPAHAPTLGHALLTVARLGTAAALVGALGALIGWVARREDLAAAVVVVLGLPYLEQVSALLGRLPAMIGLLAFSPWGAVRAVALADRGLAAPGYDRPTSVLPFALVTIGWVVALVVVALPPRLRSARSRRPVPARLPPHRVGSGRRRGRGHGRGRGRAPTVGLVAVASVVTVLAGATLPARLADSLPWRWQRSWRTAVHEGWSSGQTVDRFVAQVRSVSAVDEPTVAATSSPDPASLVSRAGSVTPEVTDALRRASRVERQPESSMRGPDQVTVRLRFDQPIVSGSAAFTQYLVRFSLVVDGDGHWHIDRTEGPVASGSSAASTGGSP